MSREGALPASGTRVRLRDPTGEDQLLVLQSVDDAFATMLALATRLMSSPAGGAIDWVALPAVDLGAAALLIRGSWLGDTIRAESLCPAAGCEQPMEVAFSIRVYLEHHRPKWSRGATDLGSGWLSIEGVDARVRIPTIGDLLAARAGGGSTLLKRCVEPHDAPAAAVRRIDRALEALAPRLDGEVHGSCPGCGATVALHFEPVGYVREELEQACRGLYAEVHELALAYHWPEPAILALDRRRRSTYVEMVQREHVLA